MYRCRQRRFSASGTSRVRLEVRPTRGGGAGYDLSTIRPKGGLVSGTQSPVHLRLRDDLRTRLAWGLVYQVQALNDTEKSRALEQHALARGFTLPPEVTHYLLRHGRRDLPSLLAVLDALDAHCLRLKRSPPGPLLKEVMDKDN